MAAAGSLPPRGSGSRHRWPLPGGSPPWQCPAAPQRRAAPHLRRPGLRSQFRRWGLAASQAHSVRCFRALLCDAPHTQKHCSNASANVSQRGSPQTLPVWTGPGLPRCSGSGGVLPARLPYYYMGGALRALTEALLRFRETLCAMGRVWRRRGPHSRFAAAGISSAHHSAPLNACDWTGRGAGTLT